MKTYTVIDFETTGLDSTVDQVTEIGAIKMSEDGELLGSFQTFVKLTDGRKPSPYAKVTEEDCENGMDEFEALLELYRFINDSTLIMQYAPFDLSFFNRAFPDDYPVENWTNFIDTRTLSKIAFPSESPSLKPTMERLGIEMGDHRRSLPDCEMAWKVFKALKDRVPYPKKYGFEYWHNTVMDFDVEGRRLKYVPYGARILVESKGWGL